MIYLLIIIPFYNAKKHIKKNFENCLKLLEFPIKIIYINDGSDDNSAEILKQKIFDVFSNLISMNIDKKRIISFIFL